MDVLFLLIGVDRLSHGLLDVKYVLMPISPWVCKGGEQNFITWFHYSPSVYSQPWCQLEGTKWSKVFHNLERCSRDLVLPSLSPTANETNTFWSCAIHPELVTVTCVSLFFLFAEIYQCLRILRTYFITAIASSSTSFAWKLLASTLPSTDLLLLNGSHDASHLVVEVALLQAISATML